MTKKKVNGIDLREVHVPVSERAMEVTRYDSGGLTRRESVTEMAANVAALFLTIWIPVLLDPVFGVLWTILWTIVVPPVVMMARERLMLKLLQRRPASTTVRYEPANIPPELLARYQRVREELNQVITDLDAAAIAWPETVEEESVR